MTNIATSRYQNQDDPALKLAWDLFQDLDNSSTAQKGIYIQRRYIIISLGWLVSFFAISTALPFVKDILPSDWARVALFILSTIVSGFMTFGSTYNRGLWWIVFRVAAETLRREIYLYRMNAGKYGKQGLSVEEKQEKLINAVDRARKQIEKLDDRPPYVDQNKNVSATTTMAAIKVKTDHNDDDGFSSMNPVQYINWRVTPQREWYSRKTSTDYRNMKNSRRLILGIGILGSALAVITVPGIEHYAVLTSAAVVVVSTITQLNMFGQTYTNYEDTAQNIKSLARRWETKNMKFQSNPAEISKFVTGIENTFQNERVTWMKQATQSQSLAEQTLVKNINEWTHSNVVVTRDSEDYDPDELPNTDLDEDDTTPTH